MVLWAAGYIFSSRDHSSISCLIALHNRWLLFCSVAKSSLNICHPMDYITSGFPVLHHLLEFAQTQVHRVVVVQSVVSNSLWPQGLQHARLPVHHHLPELAQTHVHWVSDAIQPSHPLLSPSSPALNLSSVYFTLSLILASVWLFQWVACGRNKAAWLLRFENEGLRFPKHSPSLYLSFSLWLLNPPTWRKEWKEKVSQYPEVSRNL